MMNGIAWFCCGLRALAAAFGKNARWQLLHLILLSRRSSGTRYWVAHSGQVTTALPSRSTFSSLPPDRPDRVNAG